MNLSPSNQSLYGQIIGYMGTWANYASQEHQLMSCNYYDIVSVCVCV